MVEDGEATMAGIGIAVVVIIVIVIIIMFERQRQQCACRYRNQCGPLCGCGRAQQQQPQGGCMHHSGSMDDDKARRFKMALTGSSAAPGAPSFRDHEVREFPTIVN